NILGKVLEGVDPLLRHLSSYAKVRGWYEFDVPFSKVKQELGQLHFMHRGDVEESKYHDLHLLIESALKSWQEEYSKAAIQLTYSGETRFIEVRQFNLDVLFNAVLTDAIKRLYKHQELNIRLDIRDAHAVVVFSDYGVPIENIESVQVNLTGYGAYPLQELVTRSGGELRVFALQERNIVELAWPLATLAELEPFKSDESEPDVKPSIDAVDKEWLSKIENLIEQNYSDPN
ncbi:AraC family transcriptional regulator, partial [Vibrio cholerae]|nr:AraC family transcriptional regulator [Vibrio cholerae]